MTNPVGRPTVMTEITLAKLEIAFGNGASDREACLIAGIDTQTLYSYQLAHPEYVERKEMLKDMPKYQARKNIVDAINANNVAVSQWYAERKVKEEFSQRTEQTGKDGEALIPPVSKDVIDLAKQLNDINRRNKGTSLGSNGVSTDTVDTEVQDKE